ncbi:hypothetical protein ACIBJE_07325 [Micromonospora sp. NPDC050187]|uniref:hypothetical protein n=1 Tax=Micromonospora sp. NPDC050187 TaxID=3364277 RepID=UPI00379CB3EA
MRRSNVLRAGVATVVALAGGALVAPAPAAAAQWNSVSMPYYRSTNGTVWEDYVRSHTSTSDIRFDMADGYSDFIAGTVQLKYESNGVVFGSKNVGLSATTIVSNWGATRFHFGFNGFPGSGTVVGSLYY